MSDKTDAIGNKLGVGGNNEDPIIKKLDLILETLEDQQEALEEISEKLNDLELPYNSGFSTAYD